MKHLALLLCLVLAACQPGGDADSTSGLVGPERVAAEKALCERTGGTFGRGGLAQTNICFRTPPDAGKACTKRSDCETMCLARSRTCAPVTPLFGCNEILEDNGNAVTICID